MNLVFSDITNKNNFLCYDDFLHWKEHFYFHNYVEGVYKNANFYSIDNIPSDKFIFDLQFRFDQMFNNKLFDCESNEHILTYLDIPQIVKDRVRSGTAYFTVSLPTEAIFTQEGIDAMTRFFKGLGYPLKNIVYVTNSPNGQEVINSMSENNDTICHVFYPTFLKDFQKKYPRNIVYQAAFNTLEKDFLCFNWNHHIHRLLFYVLMDKSELIENSYYSLPSVGYRGEIDQAIFEKVDAKDLLRFKITKSDIETAKNKLPKILEPDFDHNQINDSHSAPVFYRQSLVSVVTETNFFSDAIHITEKTFKPCSFEHPFVLLSSKGSLEYLHKLGFITFGKFWNEDYDKIADPIDRMLRVVELCKTIHKWDIGKKRRFLNEVQPVLKHNKHRIKTLHEQGHMFTDIQKLAL